jgi:hypothetical protein
MKLVKLKAVSDKERNKYHYILIGTSYEDARFVSKEKELPISIITLLDKNGYKKGDIHSAVTAGKLSDVVGYNYLVYQFPKRIIDIKNGAKDEYRDYTMSLEKQKDILWLVNTAECAKTSWRTAISACGSDFGVVLKVIVEHANIKKDE